MRHPWHLGVMFGVFLAVLLSAMGWISVNVLQLDRAEALARRQAMRDENVRLALWRMESILSPLIALESARQYFHYIPLIPAERPYPKMYDPIQPGEVLVGSPLLTQIKAPVLIHFQLESNGRVTSPQVPTDDMRSEAMNKGYTTFEQIQAAEQRLARLQTYLDEKFWADLPYTTLQTTTAPAVASAQPNALMLNTAVRNSIEGNKRAIAFGNAAVPSWLPEGGCEICSNVKAGIVSPLWVKDALILARKVRVNREEYVQGCQLDWPAIRSELITDVSDLLPHADLKPITALRRTPGDSSVSPWLLAALPVQLIPGNVPIEAGTSASPIRISLLVAWICVLLAAAAVGVLLRGVITLSERRGAFVSAVTHELRTPLTTLRMYTEMLAEHMVPDVQKQNQYLDTMRAEADRLAHLVENVLSYSRLERTNVGGHATTVPLNELLAKVQPRLAQRAEQAGMSITFPQDASRLTVHADPSAVEQVLFNLVDNACKYAAVAPDRTIGIQCDRRNGQIEIRVADRGPGISRIDARRLFRPFSKSARDAANSAPGVGLGLALSRRLARNMGGDLSLAKPGAPGQTGACFVLTLPSA